MDEEKEQAPLMVLEPVQGEVSGSVTISRALANASHGLNLNEKRLMMAALRCIDSRRSPYTYARDGYVRVRIRADEFAAIADLKPSNAEGAHSSAVYEGMKAACNALYDRSITWREGKKLIRLRWVFKATYHDDEAWAEICFSPDLTPHIFTLKNKFVRYELELARGLRSTYSWRLLELLMTQKDTGFYTVTVDDLRARLEVPEKWRYGQIKRDAIERAMKELNAKADLIINYRETKQGRSVHSLQFTFVKNPQGMLDV